MMTTTVLYTPPPQGIGQLGQHRLETNTPQGSSREFDIDCSSAPFDESKDCLINDGTSKKNECHYHQIVLPVFSFGTIGIDNPRHLKDDVFFEMHKEEFMEKLQQEGWFTAIETAYGILKKGGRLHYYIRDLHNGQKRKEKPVNLKIWRSKIELTFNNIKKLGLARVTQVIQHLDLEEGKQADTSQDFSEIARSCLTKYKEKGCPAIPPLPVRVTPTQQQPDRQLPPSQASVQRNGNGATQGHDRQEHPNICTPLVADPAPKPPPSQDTNSQHGNGGTEGHDNQEHLLPDKFKDSGRRHSLDASTSNDTNSISFDSEVCLKVWEEMVASGEADYGFNFDGGHPPNNAGKAGNGVQQAQQAGANTTPGDSHQKETRKVSVDQKPTHEQQYHKPQEHQQLQQPTHDEKIQGETIGQEKHQPSSPPTPRDDPKRARTPDTAGDATSQNSPCKKPCKDLTYSVGGTTNANASQQKIPVEKKTKHVLCCIPNRHFQKGIGPSFVDKKEDCDFLYNGMWGLRQKIDEDGEDKKYANAIISFFEGLNDHFNKDGTSPFIAERCEDIYVLRFQLCELEFPLDKETTKSILSEVEHFFDFLSKEYPKKVLYNSLFKGSICIICHAPGDVITPLIHSWMESKGRLKIKGSTLELIDVYSVCSFSFCQRESTESTVMSPEDPKSDNQFYGRLRESVNTVLKKLQEKPTDILYQDGKGRFSDLTVYKDDVGDEFVYLIPASEDIFQRWVNLDPFYWSSMNQILARQTGGTEPRPEATVPADDITDSVTWDSLSASSIPVGKKSYTHDTATTLPSTEADSTSGKQNFRPPSQVTEVSAPSLPLQITVSAPNMTVVRDKLLRRLENKLHPCTTLSIAQVQFRGESLSYYPRILKRKDASKHACYVHNESYRFLCFFMQAGKAADDNTGEVSRRVRFDYGDDLHFIYMSSYVPNERIKAVEPHPGEVYSEAISENNFKTILGSNSFGSKGDIEVYLVSNYDRKCDGYTLLTTECVAIKRLDSAYVLGHQDEVVNEIQHLATLGDGRHVIQLTDALIDDKNNVYIVTKYCRNGSIVNRIEKLPVSINPQEFIQTREAEAKITYRKILEALDYIHTMTTSSSKGIVHGNIQPGHFLIDDNGNILLTNFAMAGRIPELDEASVTPLRYTNDKYRLPEMSHSGYRFSPVQADVWACTVILFQILTGEDLYSYPRQEDIRFRFFLVCGAIWWNQEEADLYFSIVDHDEYPSITSMYNNSVRFFSPELKILFKNVFKLDPQSRWSTREILESSWMQEVVEKGGK